MNQDIIETMNKAGKQAFDAAKEVSALNASTFETVLEKQIEIANQIVALNTKQAKIVAEFKDAPSAFQAQAALIQEITEQAADNARDLVEIINKTRVAYDKFFQKGLKETTEAVKKARAGVNLAA